MATYLGNSSGLHLWQINGQTYTDSVSTVGGSPIFGKSYPALANQPDSRGHWVALIQPTDKFLPRPFGEQPANWPAYLQSNQRRGFAKLPETWVGGEGVLINDTFDGTCRTRIWGSSVYTLRSTNWTSPNYRHTLVETNSLTPSAPQVRSYYNATGIVEMLVTEDAIYLVEWMAGARVLASARVGHGWNANGTSATASRVRKLRRSDFAVLWTSASVNTRLLRPAPSLSIMGDKLVCLCEVGILEGGWIRPRLAQLALNIDTGAQIALTNLHGDSPDMLAITCANMYSWDAEPVTYGPQPVEVFPSYYPEVGTWGIGPDGRLPPLWSNDHASDGTLYWQGAVDAPLHDCARFHNWFVWPDIDRHIPSPRRGMQLSCWDSSGAVKWRRKGWDKGSIREVFTVLSAHPDGRMLVFVEEMTFATNSSSGPHVSIEVWESGEKLSESEGPVVVGNFVYPIAVGSGGHTSNSRFLKSMEYYFEVLDARDGSVITRRKVSPSQYRTFYLPTGGASLLPTYENIYLGLGLPGGETAPEPPNLYPNKPVINSPPPFWSGLMGEYGPPFSWNAWGMFEPSTYQMSTSRAEIYGALRPLSPLAYEGVSGGIELGQWKAVRGWQLSWAVASFVQEFPAPLPFDPFSCCLSADGNGTVFSPYWRPYYGAYDTDNEIKFEAEKIAPVSGGSHSWRMYESGEKLNVKIQMVAIKWSDLTEAWRYEYNMGGGTRHFTQGNLLGLEGNQILWHFRRSNSTSAHTQPGPGNAGYLHRINSNTGALVDARSVSGLAPSPYVSGGVYGELDQHRTALAPQRHPTESIVAGDGFLLTKMGNGQIFIT